jgi:hypothetical protein
MVPVVDPHSPGGGTEIRPNTGQQTADSRQRRGCTAVAAGKDDTMSPTPKQPITDDSIKVRQVSHYQFSWIAGDAAGPGTWTLQLVLDEGAWEEVLTIDADDADNLQDLLSSADTVFYDVSRKTLMFGTTPVGH